MRVYVNVKMSIPSNPNNTQHHILYIYEKEYRDASLVTTLTSQLEASVKRERRATMALTRSDLARRAEAKSNAMSSSSSSSQDSPNKAMASSSLSSGVASENMVATSEELEMVNKEKEELSEENSRWCHICSCFDVSREEKKIACCCMVSVS
jgi:hypothetical protein